LKNLIAVAAIIAMVAGCSLPVSLYRSAITPDIRECVELEGQTLQVAADKFGKLVSTATHAVKSEYVLVFRKGNLTATVTANGITPDSKILSVSCLMD